MILAPLLLLLAAQAPDAPSTGQAWRELGEAANGFRIFYDPAAARAGDTVTARLLTRFPPAPATAPAYAVSTAEIRCGAGEARVTRTTNYRADGAVTADDTDPVPFEPIVPGSFFANVRHAVC